MPDVLVNKDLFLKADFVPAVVNWNRLEGRPRREDFARSLRAEVRDPLWFVCRQWQFGEFRAENAGSAIEARLQLRLAPIDSYAAEDAPAHPYDERLPLEVRVEREPLPSSLEMRVRIGRHFARLAGALWAGVVKSQYLSRYALQLPADAEASAHLESDTVARAYFAAVHGRILDGIALLDDMSGGGHDPFVDALPLSDGERDALRAAASSLRRWLSRLYSVPVEGERTAWQPSRLEYRFRCGVPEGSDAGRVVLEASDFQGTHLDWYAFDVNRSAVLPVDPEIPLPLAAAADAPPMSFLPAPVEYSGMPNPRFWQFEDRKTSFGAIRASTTDLALLLLAEFGLVYGNDWLLVPYDLRVGSHAEVRGVVVTDVFGVRTFVRPAGSSPGDDWQRWNFLTLDEPAAGAVDRRLLLVPAIGVRQEGKPLDVVTFTRDEMANMAFAIEERIPGPIGAGTGGDEAAAALTKHLRRNALPEDLDLLDTGAAIRYVAGTTVPENWIPFVPVQISSMSGDIRLQRGRMARTVAGAPSPTVAPRTALLRHGLDATPPEGYFIEEEEVPSRGIRVTRAFQRVRWHDGRVFVWLGRRKTSGRGEAESGLRFDQVEPRAAAAEPA